MPQSPSFIPVIHSIRGVASLAVFFKHLLMAPFVLVPLVQQIAFFGNYGVQAFFVISGFVLPYSLLQSKYRLTDFFGFLSKRLIRLEPPYLVALALACGYLLVGNILPTAISLRQPPAARELFLHLGYLIPFFKDTQWVNMVFWSLAIEFQYYLILGLSFPLLGSGKKWQRFFFYGLFMAPTLLYSGRGLILVCLPLFLLGTISALRYKGIIKKPEFLVMFALVSLENYYKGNWAVSVVTISTVAAIHFWPMVGGRVLTFLGDISYSLYLTHFPVAMAFSNLLWPWLDSPATMFLVLVASAALGIIFAYFFYLYVEKPAKKWAQEFRKPKSFGSGVGNECST